MHKVVLVQHFFFFFLFLTHEVRFRTCRAAGFILKEVITPKTAQQGRGTDKHLDEPPLLQSIVAWCFFFFFKVSVIHLHRLLSIRIIIIIIIIGVWEQV